MGSTRALGWQGEWVRLAGPSREEHAHGDLELTLLASGSARYFLAGRFVDLPPGRLVGFWAALPHRLIAVPEPCDLAWVTVPIDAVISWNLGSAFLGHLLSGALISDDGAAEHLARRLPEWIRGLGGKSAEQRLVQVEVEAWVRHAALRHVPRRAVTAPGQDGEPVERIAAWCAAHYRADVDFADLGAAVGLHPNYAMACFRRGTGMTIGRYIQGLRLAHAHRLLLTTRRTVLDIALDAGFGSLARFYVAFRAVYHTTPLALRRGT